MKLAAIAHAIPSRRLTNDDVVGILRAQNEGRFSPEELALLEHRLRTYLSAAGTAVRFCLADSEKAIHLAVAAVRDALDTAGTAPEAVDFVIYCGVARGWIEPSTASAIQAAAGLPRATSFDVVDACAGWLRALELAQQLLRGGHYRCGLIVTGECGLYRHYLQAALTSADELEERLAAFTLGEATTATVVTDADPTIEAYIRLRTLPEYHRLCMIPLPNMPDFVPDAVGPPTTPHKFSCASRDLLRAATRAIIDMFRADPVLAADRYDLCVGHSASQKAEQLITDRLGLTSVYYPMHARYGNTGSASIPLALSVALREGRLRRGHRVLVIMGSAGITVGFGALTF